MPTFKIKDLTVSLPVAGETPTTLVPTLCRCVTRWVSGCFHLTCFGTTILTICPTATHLTQCLPGTRPPCGFTFPTDPIGHTIVELPPETLAAAREHLRARLSELEEAEALAKGGDVLPRTAEESEELERHLTGALEAVRAHRQRVAKGG
jgi:hypothetical protein